MKNKLVCIATMFILLSGCSSMQVQSPQQTARVFVIDPGHGGKDPGAQVGDVQESHIVLGVAQKILQLNQQSGDTDIKIVLVRSADYNVPLPQRVAISDSFAPDLLLTLHADFFPDKRRHGVATYFSSKNSFAKESKRMAQVMLAHLGGAQMATNPIEDQPFYVVKNANCPSILLELGSINNDKDRAYLVSEQGKNEVANAIYDSLKEL